MSKHTATRLNQAKGRVLPCGVINGHLGQVDFGLIDQPLQVEGWEEPGRP